MKARFATALLAIAMLCACALAQEMIAVDWSKKGQELRMNGSLEESLGALDKAIALDSENADDWQYKALTLRDLERINESLVAFQRALALDPRDDQARTEMAGLLIVMGMSNEAASVLDSSPDQVPQSSQERLDQSIVWRLRGKVLVEKGSYNEALEAYDRAIEFGDGQPIGEATAWIGKGSLLVRLERYEDALLAFDSALQSDYPEKDGEGKPRQTLVGSEAWLGRGKALDALGRHDEAVLAYERAVELFRSEITTQTGPSNGWRYWWMGDALQTIGLTDEAHAAFAKAKELGYQGLPPPIFFKAFNRKRRRCLKTKQMTGMGASGIGE